MLKLVNRNRIGASIAVCVLMASLPGCRQAESPTQLVAEARRHAAAGDQGAAVIQLKNALSKAPNDYAARLLLATVYNGSGDAASAEKEILRALALKPGDPVALRELAISLLSQQKYQPVLDATQAPAALADARILTLRGNALLALRQSDAAKQSFDKALALEPYQVNGMLGLSQHALATGDTEAAYRLAEAAAQKHPADAQAWLMKAMVAGARGASAEALAAYGEAIKVAPHNRSARLERAFILIGQKNYDEARADIDVIRKTSPGNLMVVYADGLLEYAKGNAVGARDAAAKVLRVAPEHMPTVLLAGAVELKLRAYQQAERHLKKYVETLPDNDYARRLLASTYLKLGQASDALNTLAPLLQGEQANPQILALAAEAHLQLRDFEKATSMLELARAHSPKVAALHTAMAVAKIGQGDDASAVNALELSASLDSATSTAGTLLVLTELRLKNFDKALAAVEALKQTHPKDPKVFNLEGGVYLAKRDLVKARAGFEAAMALQPNFFASLANLAQLDLDEKKPGQAKARVEAYLQKEPTNAPAMTFLATLAMSQGKTEEATRWYERATAQNPNAVTPALQLTAHYMAIGQPTKALDLVRKNQAAHPADAALLGMLGEAQVINGDIAGAVESYTRQARVLPKSAAPHVRLAALHLRQKNVAAAAEDYQRALQVEPKHLAAQIGKLEMLARAGKLDLALALARKVQQENPTSAMAFVAEGDLLMLQKKADSAVAAYEKALQINRTAPALLKVVAALKFAGKGAEADQRVAQWRREFPGDDTVLLYQAEDHFVNGRNKPAIAAFEELLKRNAKNPIILNNLALAYYQEKDGRAVATAQRALAIEPNSPSVLDTAGSIMADSGDVKGALPHLRRAVLLSPDTGEIRYHLAQALLKDGDKPGAKAELTLALAREPGFRQARQARALLATL